MRPVSGKKKPVSWQIIGHDWRKADHEFRSCRRAKEKIRRVTVMSKEQTYRVEKEL